MAESPVMFLLDRLTMTLEEKLSELKGVKEAVESIRDELERVTAFLRVADSMEETDMEIKVWVKQVRDVAYDLEDFLDTFNHHEQGHEAAAASVCSSILGWISSRNFNSRIASEIRSIRSRVLSISEGHRRYQFKLSASEQSSNLESSMAYERRGDALLIEEADLVGITRRKEEVVGWILEGGSRLGVVSVVGMGGLGKTTLVKRVYDDAHVKKHFQSHAWITVSQSFKFEEVVKDTIQQLFDEVKQPVPKGVSNMSMNQLKSVIKQFLKERRYLLVFDDVWSIQAWEGIKYAFPDGGCGSRVVITTRLVDVGLHATMGTDGHAYHLKPLTEQESWTLFCQKAFRGGPCPPHMVEISHSILRRCAGLPLAIVAVGGVLATKRLDNWLMLSNSLGAELEGNDTLESMRLILLLSFNDLPYYLKSCFLYLSIYPEDHVMQRNSLIRIWIMEGFIKPKKGRTVEEVAEGYLNELVNRNLLRLVRSNDDGSVKSILIHDFFREMILTKSRDQSFLMAANEHTTGWISKARRLSIHTTFAAKLQVQDCCCSHLQSLVAFGVTDPKSLSAILKLLKKCRMLKVLDLSGSPLEEFPEAITKLIHLRYLSMRSTNITKIPRSIKNLQKLETLDLKHSYVTELPIEILKLQSLRHLIVYRCKEYSYLTFDFTLGFRPPTGMGALTSLHQLSFIEVTPESGILKEIGKMKELRRLCIVKLRREDGNEACSCIEGLHNLRALNISSTEEDEVLDLQSLSSPPVFMQRLYMSGRLAKVPHWISSLDNLVKIYFRWSRLRDDPLEYLQDLPNLVHLEFLVAYVGDELRFKAGRFQKLRLLDLDKLEPLREVVVEVGAMPKLEKMIIQRCTFLERVPIGIEKLDKMQVVEFFDMPDEFIAKLLSSKDGGDYQRVAHIPQVYYTYWRDGGWEAHSLDDEADLKNVDDAKVRTVIRTNEQRNSL
ncbi:hypothetical protein C2S51_031681 [Perilla frutescens var. frutescens]|nr:hypothetical protein C2S51_031681 [Perilla frutescens var. frutescens]